MPKHPEIVLEIGPTHTGFNDAIKLIDATKAEGADAIKVQICSPEHMVHPDHPLTVTYKHYALKPNKNILIGSEEDWYTHPSNLVLTEVTEDMATILERRKLPPHNWDSLIRHAHSLGLKFYATVGSSYDLDIVVRAKVDGIKICSGDILYHQLIHEAAKTGIPIQLDTANSTLEEINKAIGIIYTGLKDAYKDKAFTDDIDNITIHHCPSGYPAPDTSVNLNTIKKLIDIWGYIGIKTGFSDHSLNHTACIIATSLGVDYIEKTLTSSRYKVGPEHCMSIEPHEIADFVALIRSVPILMGKAEYEIDHKKQASIRRGVYMINGIGQYLRPYNGISPADVYPPDYLKK